MNDTLLQGCKRAVLCSYTKVSLCVAGILWAQKMPLKRSQILFPGVLLLAWLSTPEEIKIPSGYLGGPQR